MSGWPGAYNERMAELGFSTYVFIERIAANAAALHPFPEHNVALVRDALADAGFDITLLGPDEADYAKGTISIQSPVGVALLGKEVGDEITVNAPRGRINYEIIDIQFKKKTA